MSFETRIKAPFLAHIGSTNGGAVGASSHWTDQLWEILTKKLTFFRSYFLPKYSEQMACFLSVQGRASLVLFHPQCDSLFRGVQYQWLLVETDGRANDLCVPG